MLWPLKENLTRKSNIWTFWLDISSTVLMRSCLTAFLSLCPISYALEGDMYSEDPEPGTPTNGKLVRAEVTKIKFNRDRTSEGTASTQLSNQSKGQTKVVINYADLVKEQRKLEGENGADVAISDRNNSNLSIGYNHAPTSPMR